MIKKYNDSKYINKDTLLYYANTNEDFLSFPVKGVVIEFPGLDGGSCLGGSMTRDSYSTEWAERFGKKGILLVYLFPGPWSWGAKASMRMANAVIGAIFDKYTLPNGFPLVSCGGSMGSVGALMFAAESEYKLCHAAVACPCADIPDRLDCHPDFPRTYISAAAQYDMELEDALKMFSPIHRISDLPEITYFICSDGADELFPEEQCDLYVEKLKNAGLTVEYYKQPGLGHGGFTPEIREKLHLSIESAILKK